MFSHLMLFAANPKAIPLWHPYFVVAVVVFVFVMMAIGSVATVMAVPSFCYVSTIYPAPQRDHLCLKRGLRWGSRRG